MEINALQKTLEGFKKIDQNSGAKDSKINISVYAVSKNGDQIINPEYQKARKLISEIFGLTDKPSMAETELLHYFDHLDGQDDELVDLAKFATFIKTISQKPNKKDEMVSFLKDRVQSFKATARALEKMEPKDISEIERNSTTAENLNKIIEKLSQIKPNGIK